MINKLTPFKLFLCNNSFPFIEEDFDSLTNYQLLSKIVGYIQSQIIPTIDETTEAQNNVLTKFIELKNYVDNYFDNLDVQEEINKKLDEMAENGTLQEYFEKYFSEYLIPFKNEVNQTLNEQNNKINSIANGSPIPVNSIGNMTDTSKIYVLTSDGNWYYYNGSSWVIGGVYQSSQLVLDDTLTNPNEAPVSQIVGNFINTLNNNILNVDNKINPIVNKITGYYYNINNEKIQNNEWEYYEVDISLLAGKSIEIIANQEANARTLLVTTSNEIYIQALQNGNKIILIVPENGAYLRISNKISLGSASITILNTGKNVDLIYNTLKVEKTKLYYKYWDNIVNSDKKVNYNNNVNIIYNDSVGYEGYLTLKINTLKSVPINILKLDEENNILDTYSTFTKIGDNIIKTPLYFLSNNKLGVSVEGIGAIQYVAASGYPSKYSGTSSILESYKGNKLDTTDYKELNTSWYIDYTISQFEELNIDNINQTFKTTDISSYMLNNTDVKIKIIGDSITAGYGIGQEKAWSGLLKTYFESVYSCTVTINAQSGKSSQWVVDNISTLIDDSDNILLLMIGTNNRYSEDSYNALIPNLQYIYNYCRERNINFIPIVPPISTPEGTNGESLENRTYHMDNIVHKITSFCYDNKLNFIDTYENLYDTILISKQDINSYFIDGLHPTADTSYLLFRLISKGLVTYPKIKNATW